MSPNSHYRVGVFCTKKGMRPGWKRGTGTKYAQKCAQRGRNSQNANVERASRQADFIQESGRGTQKHPARQQVQEGATKETRQLRRRSLRCLRCYLQWYQMKNRIKSDALVNFGCKNFSCKKVVYYESSRVIRPHSDTHPYTIDGMDGI